MFFSPGEYVALAGARLDGAEMLACGLATHFVPSHVGSLVTQILTELPNFLPVMMFAVIFMVILLTTC